MKITKYALAFAALLFAALGSTTAHADTIVTDSGGNVIGINGITIAGTTYNVTWGTVIDTTFAASPTNAAAINQAIAHDLSTLVIQFVADNVSTSIDFVGVDAGTVTDESVQELSQGWIPFFQSTTTDYSNNVVNHPDFFAWDEFTVVAAPVPEPSSLLLLGTGLVGLAGAMRRKRLTVS